MDIMCRNLFRSLAVVVLIGTASLPLALSASARSQEPQQPAESIVNAARNARKQASNSTARTKIVTNDDLSVESPMSSASTNPAKSPSPSRIQAPKPQPAHCHKPADDQRLKQELHAPEAELYQPRRELSYEP